jgi:hypothetical protein
MGGHFRKILRRITKGKVRVRSKKMPKKCLPLLTQAIDAVLHARTAYDEWAATHPPNGRNCSPCATKPITRAK